MEPFPFEHWDLTEGLMLRQRSEISLPVFLPSFLYVCPSVPDTSPSLIP
jgi:hypothetical protein